MGDVENRESRLREVNEREARRKRKGKGRWRQDERESEGKGEINQAMTTMRGKTGREGRREERGTR